MNFDNSPSTTNHNWTQTFVEYDALRGTHIYKPLSISVRATEELERLGFQPAANITVSADNWVAVDGESVENVPFQSHLPAMPGDPGPTGYPLAYTRDGTLIEYFEWAFPIVVMRGRQAIEHKLKEYEDRIWALDYALQQRVGQTTVNIDDERRFRAIRSRYGYTADTLSHNTFTRNEAIRDALAWVLGETDGPV